MSVQPTSEKLTVLHCAGSAACANIGKPSATASSSDLEPFMGGLLGFSSRHQPCKPEAIYGFRLNEKA
jgi:hypothetical protein